MFVLEWFYNTRNFILTTFCSFLVTQSSHSICDDVEEANALPSRLAGIRGSPELIKALLKKHFIKNAERQQNYQTCENKRLIWKGRKHIANYKAVTCFFFSTKVPESATVAKLFVSKVTDDAHCSTSPGSSLQSPIDIEFYINLFSNKTKSWDIVGFKMCWIWQVS